MLSRNVMQLAMPVLMLMSSWACGRDTTGLRDELRVAPDTATALQATTTMFTVSGLAAERGVSWRSSDSAVAVVYSNGLVSARHPGTATVTAVSNTTGGSASAKLVVIDLTAADSHLGLEAITRSGTREIVSSLSGMTDLHLRLKVPAAAHAIEMFVDGVGRLTLQHTGATTWLVIPFDSRTLTNGAHSLRFRSTAPGTVLDTGEIAIAIAN